MQGCHDVVGGARDAGIADEVGHGRDADGKQHARDREDDHQFEQRESGLGSFHGLHYKERRPWLKRAFRRALARWRRTAEWPVYRVSYVGSRVNCLTFLLAPIRALN